MVRRQGPASARLLLALGLMVSAALVAAVGGGWGYVIAAIQLALGVALLVRPESPGPIAGAMISLIPAPFAAIRHWTAGLPGTCKCARLPHPPPALVSLTGAAVTFELALLGYALWLTAPRRRSHVLQPGAAPAGPLNPKGASPEKESSPQKEASTQKQASTQEDVS